MQILSPRLTRGSRRLTRAFSFAEETGEPERPRALRRPARLIVDSEPYGAATWLVVCMLSEMVAPWPMLESTGNLSGVSLLRNES